MVYLLKMLSTALSIILLLSTVLSTSCPLVYYLLANILSYYPLAYPQAYILVYYLLACLLFYFILAYLLCMLSTRLSIFL